MEQTIYWVLAIGMIVIGLAGTILPAIPGVGLVFLGLLLAAWIEGFQKVGVPMIVALGFITALAMAIDFVAGLLGAKKMGASKLAMLGAAIGAVVGLFMGIIGVFIGPFVGAVIGELIYRGKLNEAGAAAKVGLGTWLGILFGSLAKLALAMLMVVLFIASYLF